MKATGIVRRIDDLGRVVIPKEIRRTMRIREGDPLEIFTDNDGEVIFKNILLSANFPVLPVFTPKSCIKPADTLWLSATVIMLLPSPAFRKRIIRTACISFLGGADGSQAEFYPDCP